MSTLLIKILLEWSEKDLEMLQANIAFRLRHTKFSVLTRKVSQVSLTDFNDSLICCRASKNKTHVKFFIGGKTDLGGEIDP